jgi:hypothetical protein
VIEFRKFIADSSQMKLRFRLGAQNDGSCTATLAILDDELPVPSITSGSPIVGNVDIDMRKDNHTNNSCTSAGTPLY